MKTPDFSHNIRVGRFLWMDESTKKSYLDLLYKKIAEGYFSSENILNSIVEDMAQVFDENTTIDISAKC